MFQYLENRFFVDENDCWVWVGMTDDGYGRFWFRQNDKKRRIMAHRASYETFIAVIPKNLFIDHLCRNRKCINPEHLEPVTVKVNVLRGEGITAVNAQKTHCKNGHEFTKINTYIHPKRGTRQCKRCSHENTRRHRRKLALKH